MELGKYIAAVYDGLTPGQQSAAVCMVTPRELKRAKGDLVLAMVGKARDLAMALECSPAEAWVLMAKERMELMAYVHQRQPQALPIAAETQLPSVFVVPDGLDAPMLEMSEEIDADVLQVAWSKSPDQP